MKAIAKRAGGLLAAAAFAGGLLSAPDARAIERQHHVGVAPAIGSLRVDGKSTASTGIGGALHYAYGLSDQWNLSVEASSVVVAANQKQDSLESPRNRPATVDHGALGVHYVIDILRWVPYIGLNGGVYRLAGGTLDSALILPGLSIGAGVDYQLNRRFAVGLGVRQHLMISKMDTYPSYTTALLRFEYMWGY
ncbi:MAG: outer membrane beta-barrel protein [Labilithrix sp.]|nr:outer membrane beta-barrel protein [Labilithrix sp.]MCW5831298.1 outer membrane beta-barrel protein [Labilithrix sp.]